ncbi:MAG: MFS transporter [Candidatus Nezhaarchaeales archaeon]
MLKYFKAAPQLSSQVKVAFTSLQARRTLMVSSMFHFINDATLLVLPAVSPILFKEFNFSYYDAGLLYGVTLSLMVVFQVFFGFLSDKYNELNVIAAGNFLIASSCILLASASSRLELFIYNAVFAIGASAFHPASYAALSRVNRDLASRTRHMGFSGSAGDFGSFIAVASTGLLLGLIGWRNLFTAWAFIALLAFIVYISILKSNFKIPPLQVGVEATLSGNVKPTLRTLTPLLILCLAMGGIHRIHINFVPLLLTDSLGLTASVSSTLFSLFILSGCMGALVSGLIVNRLGPRKALFTVFIAVFPLSLILWLHSYTWRILVFVSIVISGFTSYATYPIIYGLFSQIVKAGSRGRAYGFIVGSAFIGGSLYSFIGGKLADLASNVSATFALSSITGLAAALTSTMIEER